MVPESVETFFIQIIGTGWLWRLNCTVFISSFYFILVKANYVIIVMNGQLQITEWQCGDTMYKPANTIHTYSQANIETSYSKGVDLIWEKNKIVRFCFCNIQTQQHWNSWYIANICYILIYFCQGSTTWTMTGSYPMESSSRCWRWWWGTTWRTPSCSR